MVTDTNLGFLVYCFGGGGGGGVWFKNIIFVNEADGQVVFAFPFHYIPEFFQAQCDV